MLYQPDRHERLQPADLQGWDEDRVRAFIAAIVREAESAYRPGHGWPVHPLDEEPGDDPGVLHPTLYSGTCGVLWALHHLSSQGAVLLERDWPVDAAALVRQTRGWLRDDAPRDRAACLVGETPVWLLAHACSGSDAAADRLAELIEGNVDHPARDLMLGAAGTLLAALVMHQRTGQERFGHLFRHTAAVLWSQLEWSEAHGCRYWTQVLHGQTSAYMDAVHGFVGTALPLIRGRHLLREEDWAAWQACIASSVRRSATLEAAQDGGVAGVNWVPWLLLDAAQRDRWNAHPRWLLQYCHGSPGFVINLAGFPGSELDDLMVAAGETTWAAGPLKKGSNLCHGTGGNGYAFLKLFKRTGDVRWLQRARAFAMHGIRQTQAHAAQYGHMRYSLWTGDLGFAVYLWDCLRAEAAFPTLDVF
jgi:hypothetical protein